MRFLFPGTFPRLMFCCELSFSLSYFSGDWVFDLTVSCLVRSAGSEKVLTIGGFFGPLLPCAGPLVIMGIGGFISSTTCSLGEIKYRGASRVSFWL